ncbi:MAG TPA: GtrA family protein [Rhodocyclaceae bacterium]|nr:GtrA family protein [Rhodocyclaceae bacterium]
MWLLLCSSVQPRFGHAGNGSAEVMPERCSPFLAWRPFDHVRVLRYLVAGVVSAAANIVGFVGALWVSGLVPVGVVAGYAVAYTINFSMNRLWVFRGGERRMSSHLIRFAVLSILYMAANVIIFHLLGAVSLADWMRQAVCIGVLAPCAFLALQRWVFT